MRKLQNSLDSNTASPKTKPRPIKILCYNINPNHIFFENLLSSFFGLYTVSSIMI